DCQDLAQLYLHSTRATDDWLKQIAAFKRLKFLDLSRTEVTDAGLEHLRECQELMTLIVQNTRTSPRGVATFHAAVLSCKIEHDGGVLAADPDRRAAVWALSVGGTVGVTGRTGYIKAIADLPEQRFALVYLDVGLVRAVTDADLARLRECK